MSYDKTNNIKRYDKSHELNAMKKKYKKYDILYVIACLQSKSNSIDHLVPQYSAL